MVGMVNEKLVLYIFVSIIKWIDFQELKIQGVSYLARETITLNLS